MFKKNLLKLEEQGKKDIRNATIKAIKEGSHSCWVLIRKEVLVNTMSRLTLEGYTVKLDPIFRSFAPHSKTKYYDCIFISWR